jgi:hypothetical protein
VDISAKENRDSRHFNASRVTGWLSLFSDCPARSVIDDSDHILQIAARLRDGVEVSPNHPRTKWTERVPLVTSGDAQLEPSRTQRIDFESRQNSDIAVARPRERVGEAEAIDIHTL